MAEIKWDASPNFSSRSGRKPIAIVNHITAGSMPGCLSWLKNPSAQASAHYIVTRSGEIYQLVKDENAAWHAGAVNKPSWSLYDGTNPNRYTIGIEHEGQPNVALTEAQYQATLQLHRELINKHSIPIDTEHIIGHYRIDSVNRPNCPGPKFPWDRLFNDLRMGVIDVALEKWMIEGGQSALKELAEKGLVNNVDMWNTEEELAKSVPAYLFWMLLNRVANYGRG